MDLLRSYGGEEQRMAGCAYSIRNMLFMGCAMTFTLWPVIALLIALVIGVVWLLGR